MSFLKILDKKAEIHGKEIANIIGSLESFQRIAEMLMKRNGFNKVNVEQWYPIQKWMVVFRQLNDILGPYSLHKLGQRIGNKIELPQVQSIEEAFLYYADLYKEKYKFDDIGGYNIELVSDNQLKIESYSCYPCEMDVGLLESIVNRLVPESEIKVSHELREYCRKRGALNCSYIIEFL